MKLEALRLKNLLGLTRKMFSFLVDNSEHEKAKCVNRNTVAAISINNCKDVFLNNKYVYILSCHVRVSE